MTKTDQLKKLIKDSDFDSAVLEAEKQLKGSKVPEIRTQAKKIFKEEDLDSDAIITLAKKAQSSNCYEVRFFGVLLLGLESPDNKNCLQYMQKECSKDSDWRVQEALAMAFDMYCSGTGYENCIDLINQWMRDKNENVRRAVSEGPRIWTSRMPFKEKPELAIELLGNLKSDNSLYVKKSAANALSDISKKYPDLVLSYFSDWAKQADQNAKWVIKNASRHLIKNKPEETNNIFKTLEVN